jgi:signal transduction histidine kinase
LEKIIVDNSVLFSSVPQSNQISAIYRDIAELTELLIIYFKQGIETGEYCLWISPDDLFAEETKNELKKSGIDVERFINSSQLEILPAESLNKNITTLESKITELVEKGYEKVLSKDFTGFRTNFDFTNLGITIENYLGIYKNVINKIAFNNSKNLTFLYTFPLDELSGITLLALMEENSIVVKRKRKWKYLENLEIQTEFKKTLIKEKNESEFLNRVKNEFIMNLSHELRTPLNSVIGFSDLLLEGAFGSLNTRQSKYVNNILISGKNLLEIINNLLDILKLEAGDRSLNYEIVDIVSLLTDIRMSLLSSASNKKIVLELKIDASIENIRADKTKLRQILYNLVSNAIRFTPKKGKVTVSAFKKENMLEIIVSDTGEGMFKKYYEKMFMSSTQTNPSTTLGYLEAGVGLYIVKNFIDLHRGKIWVDYREGKDSTFTFALPIDSAEGPLSRK